MFEVGFWELALLFALGLIVLGPEKLPKVADQLGRYAGQARRMARTFTSQIREEIETEERRASHSTPTATAADQSVPAFSRPGVDALIPNAAETAAAAETEISPAAAGPLDQVRGSGS
jgi:Tat protein translocase TatB subunit